MARSLAMVDRRKRTMRWHTFERRRLLLSSRHSVVPHRMSRQLRDPIGPCRNARPLSHVSSRPPAVVRQLKSHLRSWSAPSEASMSTTTTTTWCTPERLSSSERTIEQEVEHERVADVECRLPLLLRQVGCLGDDHAQILRRREIACQSHSSSSSSRIKPTIMCSTVGMPICRLWTHA